MTLNVYFSSGQGNQFAHLGRKPVANDGMSLLANITPAEADQILLELAPFAETVQVVDRAEVASLLSLAEEADDDDNQYDSAAEAWREWQDRCEALVEAVRALFKEA